MKDDSRNLVELGTFLENTGKTRHVKNPKKLTATLEEKNEAVMVDCSTAD